EERTTTLVITTPDGRELRRSALRLGPDATHRVVFQLAEGSPAVEARIDDDELAIDNRVRLLPALTRPVRVDVRVGDGTLRPLAERAVRATRGVTLSARRPDLVISDGPDEAGPDAWVVRLLAEKEAEAFVGPFVLDRAHPLTEGLSLRGVIWGAGKQAGLE